MREFIAGEKCAVFIMSNEQIQSHFNDSSMVLIDRKKKLLVFFSVKHAKMPALYPVKH